MKQSQENIKRIFSVAPSHPNPPEPGPSTRVETRPETASPLSPPTSLDISRVTLECFFTVELIAMFERIAHFGQTGNARVLNRTLMDRFLLTVVVRRGMLPYLGEHIKLYGDRGGTLSLKVAMENWPTTGQRHSPLVSSVASIAYHHGQKFANVSNSTFIQSHFLLYPMNYRGTYRHTWLCSPVLERECRSQRCHVIVTLFSRAC